MPKRQSPHDNWRFTSCDSRVPSRVRAQGLETNRRRVRATRCCDRRGVRTRSCPKCRAWRILGPATPSTDNRRQGIDLPRRRENQELDLVIRRLQLQVRTLVGDHLSMEQQKNAAGRCVPGCFPRTYSRPDFSRAHARARVSFRKGFFTGKLPAFYGLGKCPTNCPLGRVPIRARKRCGQHVPKSGFIRFSIQISTVTCGLARPGGFLGFLGQALCAPSSEDAL